MSEKPIWYLENLDVGKILCPKKLGEHQDEKMVKLIAKGEYVYLPSEESEVIYFIKAGRVKIGTHSEDGKEIIKAILNPGEVFGELSLVGEHKRSDYAIATADTELCCIKANEMSELIANHSSLSLFFMKMMGSKVIEMENRLESLVFKDSRSRIVEFIIDLVAKRGERVGYEWVVRNFITHQEIANMTATSRQSVTTLLNELRTMELITFNRKRLLIRDLDKLKEELK